MTNAELSKEIKALGFKIEKSQDDARKERDILRGEIFQLKLELSIFKGKSFGFMAALSLIFTLITNVSLAYLTKGK